MKTIMVVLSLLCSIAHGQEPAQEKVFFTNSPMSENYFYSEVTYQPPSWLKKSNGKLPVSSKNFTPGNALELEYVSTSNGTWQAKVFYNTIRGIDSFRPATHLIFWLYLESETIIDELPALAISENKKGASPVLSLKSYTGQIQQNKWMRIAIPIKDFGPQFSPADLATIIFRQPTTVAPRSDTKLHRIYVDQIELSNIPSGQEINAKPQLLTAEGFEKHVDIVWPAITAPGIKYVKIYRSEDNKTFIPVGIQSRWINRYADFVDVTNKEFFYKITLLNDSYQESSFSNVVSAVTKKMTDDQWLDMVQRANFHYYWEAAEPHSGMALENIPGRQNMIASGASGFGIMALIVGTERKFITREQAIERFDRITRFLEKAEKFHGAYSHFIDGPTGKVEPFFGPNDNGGDLVETSFLMQGLLAAQQYFDRNNEAERSICDRIQRIWEGIEWNWYRRSNDGKFLFWHWSPDKTWVINHKLIGWNETMITYLLAIASPTHPIPASLYYSGWASQSDEAQKYRTGWGQTTDGSHYTNGKTYYGVTLKVGVSNGGPLFFTHYSNMGADPRQIRDAFTDYFSNNRNIALINYRYCIENPEKHKGYGPDCWGLTASDGMWKYSANEPTPHADDGKITPTGALASFPYLPDESMAAMKNYYNRYGKFLWGEYGFRDAFNLDENWCSEIYMGLNQAPIVVMIENYRTGLIWNLFMKNKDIQDALTKISRHIR
jgi:hypothetical protein